MILVTGGDGFIGRYVCSALYHDGHDVVAVDLKFTTSSPWRYECGDLADYSFLDALFEKYSVEMFNVKGGT